MSHSALSVLACVLALGCSDPAADPPDAGAAPDTGPRIDADPNRTCNTEVMENVIEDREIREGDFCDVIRLCADGADAAATITAIAPEFVCGDEQTGCRPDEVSCVWTRPHTLDTAEYEDLCAISVLDDPPHMQCWVYL